MKIHEKIIQSPSFLYFTDFQLKFYRVHIFYLCRNWKQNNWRRHKVGHA